jgi:hypothetical protein
MTTQPSIWYLLFDRVLIVLLIAVATTALAALLERYKASQAWYTELSRERLRVMRDLLTLSQDVVSSFLSSRIHERGGDGEQARTFLQRSLEARLKLGVVVNEAGVLISEEVGRAFEQVGLVPASMLGTPATSTTASEDFQVANAPIKAAGELLRSTLRTGLSDRAQGSIWRGSRHRLTGRTGSAA